MLHFWRGSLGGEEYNARLQNAFLQQLTTLLYDKRLSLYKISPIHFEEEDVKEMPINLQVVT